MKFETTIKTIKNLVDENVEFVIPVYQRPYVWDDEEIKKLLGDVLNNFSIHTDRPNYFVGNTYVIKSANKNREFQYELIDGQQRFTTFWLIANAFKLLNIETDMTQFLEITYPNKSNDIRFDFDIRIEVSNYLKGLLNNNTQEKYANVSEKEFLKYIAKGVETIKHFITSEIDPEVRASFGNYIYDHVRFVMNIAPKNTDLNALFTALGTSGIQLQQSDILKARLLEKVPENSRLTYAKIWEACEDMNNYFEKNVVEIFKVNRENIKFEDFRTYDQTIFQLSTNSLSQDDQTLSKTIKEIVLESTDSTETTDQIKNDSDAKCRSIVSFNVFLIHAYRIYNLIKKNSDFEHSIDNKQLLLTIKLDSDISSEKDVKEFFLLLWKLRYLFDKHVVKWRFEEDDDQDEKLLLTSILESISNGKKYFSRTNSSYSSHQMLQSVLYFTGGFSQQYWLTPFLFYLLENEEISFEQIHKELEKIDNHMLPGDKKEISLKLSSQEARNEKVNLNAIQVLNESLGTSFHHYWFYKLEYVLWKEWDKTDLKFQKYRITSKNSIEHVFPQNHEFGVELENSKDDWLNSFGNLGLLSIIENSSYNNQDVRKKKVDFDHKSTYDSLKLALIYSSENISVWDVNNIQVHQDEMIQKLIKHYS
jgi:uncharacterized protein with ParB-like and HNH nuclease domain